MPFYGRQLAAVHSALRDAAMINGPACGWPRLRRVCVAPSGTLPESFKLPGMSNPPAGISTSAIQAAEIAPVSLMVITTKPIVRQLAADPSQPQIPRALLSSRPVVNFTA